MTEAVSTLSISWEDERKYPPSQGQLVKVWLALGNWLYPSISVAKLQHHRSLRIEEKREKGHNEPSPDPQRQAEGGFKEHVSILQTTNRLSLRTTKERPLDFRKSFFDFSTLSREVSLEAKWQGSNRDLGSEGSGQRLQTSRAAGNKTWQRWGVSVSD